jgi:hypothetical protein
MQGQPAPPVFAGGGNCANGAAKVGGHLLQAGLKDAAGGRPANVMTMGR